MKKHLFASLLIAAAIGIAGCNKNTSFKNESSCSGPSRLYNNAHRAYTDNLAEVAPELMDSVEKYNLQVRHVVIAHDYVRMDCNVWLRDREDIQLFFASYGLNKHLPTGNIGTAGNNITHYDLGGLSISPEVTYEVAYDLAFPDLQKDGKCLQYTLGVYDEGPLLSVDTPVYRLAWKFEGTKTGTLVFVDAHEERIIHKQEGFIIE